MSEEGELKDFQPARGIFGYFNQTEASQFHSNPRLMTTESQKSNKLTSAKDRAWAGIRFTARVANQPIRGADGSSGL